MQSTLGSTFSSDFIDSYVSSYISGLVLTAAEITTVNTAVATSLCSSTSGDNGYCNMSDSSGWETDTDCMSCYNGFLNGSLSKQTNDIYYTALRSSLADGVDTGVTAYVLQATYTVIVSVFT